MALTDNLVGYWKLDEASGNRADSVGSSTLTDVNTVTAATGKYGLAASFASASSEYLEIADNAALSTGNIDFTFACWVKFSSLGGYPCVASKGWASSAGANREWCIFLDSSNNRLWLAVQGSADGGINSATVLSINTWYYVVAWHDATNNQLGISVNNGTPDTVAHSTGVQDGTGAFRIGSSDPGQGIFHNGLIDEAGFWKRVLSADDRTQLYNSGAGLTYPFISGGEGVVDVFDAIKQAPTLSLPVGGWPRLSIIPAGVWRTQNVSDGLLLGDSRFSGTEIERQRTEALSIAESLQKIAAFARSYSDAIALSDGAITHRTFGRSMQDALAVLDSVLKQANKRLSDDVSILESLLKLTNKQLSDNMSLGDTGTRFITHFKSIVDSMTLSEALVALSVFTKYNADTLNMADAITMVAAFKRVCSDGFAIQDTLTKFAHLPKVDTMLVLDRVTKTMMVPFSDALALSEYVIASISRIVNRTDSINMSDVVWFGLFRDRKDFLVMADAVFKVWNYRRACIDAAQLGDSVSHKFGFARLPSNPLTIGDTVSHIISMARAYSNAVTLNDVVSPVLIDLLLRYGDPIALNENLFAVLYAGNRGGRGTGGQYQERPQWQQVNDDAEVLMAFGIVWDKINK